MRAATGNDGYIGQNEAYSRVHNKEAAETGDRQETSRKKKDYSRENKGISGNLG
jgi:hypothetical protein